MSKKTNMNKDINNKQNMSEQGLMEPDNTTKYKNLTF